MLVRSRRGRRNKDDRKNPERTNRGVFFNFRGEGGLKKHKPPVAGGGNVLKFI